MAKPQIEYAWKTNPRHPAIDPQVVGETIERIAKEQPPTPDAILEEAEDESSPLHPAFEWDDTKAAEEHRRSQARSLVANVVIHRIDNKLAPENTRAFVSVTTEPERTHYVSMIEAVSDATLRMQMHERALAELKAWRSKYQALEEFAQGRGVIWRVMDEVREFLNEEDRGDAAA